MQYNADGVSRFVKRFPCIKNRGKFMSVSQSILESYVAQRPESIRYYDRACRAMAGGVGHDLRHLEPVP